MAIADLCKNACVLGHDIHLTIDGKKPKGFPRGELLSIGSDGSRNYAFDPLKVLAWIRDAKLIKVEDIKP